MRHDWVPASAAALVAGVAMLALGALLLPDTGGQVSGEVFSVIRRNDGRWLGVSVLFFGAAVAMIIGLPAVLTLFDRRGALLGLVGVGVFTIGCLGIAGYAMLLVFFRSLVLSNALRPRAFEEVTGEPALAGFLATWIIAFYLGELLIALALLRARATPRWVPLVMIVHVLSLGASEALPDTDLRWTIALLAIGFAGVAIAANGQTVSRRQRSISYAGG